MVWEIFQSEAWRIRTAGMGAVVGIETNAALRKCARAGIDPILAEDMIAACERGFVTAISERDDDED